MRTIELPPKSAFAGGDGSGKDTIAADAGELSNTPTVGLGDILKDIAIAAGEEDPNSRLARRTISKQLAEAYNDPAIMAKIGFGDFESVRLGDREVLLPRYTNDAGEVYLTSIRRMAEAEEVRRRGGAVIWIHVPIEERYRRLQDRARGSEDQFASFEEYVKKVEQEMYPENRDDPNTVNVSRVFASADAIYFNPQRTSAERKAHVAQTFRLPRES